LETFCYQYENIEVYKKFVNYLKINPLEINRIGDIPFLPIEMFKNHLILDKNSRVEKYFQSSGTADIQTRSRHFIADFSLYEKSIYKSFRQFIGKPEDFIVLGLLPNYSENPHSSLIYMVDFLMKKSAKLENGYFLYNHAELFNLLMNLKNKKIILFGVSFALLDFLYFIKEKSLKFINHEIEFSIIETGGMKGRKEEMTKDELLKILQNGFQTERIFSEYSMTELLSQAYSSGKNIYETPNWMRILVRNTEDPFSYVEAGKTGAVNIIDLANVHSCSFIATQDLGRTVSDEKNPDSELPFDFTQDDKMCQVDTSATLSVTSRNPIQNPKFEILGRIDHSDIRGCSLLIS
jgi:hypothetical protein